jgi:xanthosine phosphorylase
MTNQTSQQNRAARAIKKRYPNFTPKIGIVLGSGLGGLAQQIEEAVEIPYDELPDFGHSTVPGHEGTLVLGYLEGIPVACLKGRFHYYEGIANPAIQILVRTLKLIGCEIFLATNAAGSMKMEAGPGSLLLVTDHLNFQGTNPLVGLNDDEFGPRFVSMSQAYDLNLRQRMLMAAQELNIVLHQGVYIAVLGPSFETPAEIRAFMTLGADVVGMSTVPEVIVARHCGLRVVVISAITNFAAGLAPGELSHEETLHFAEKVSGNMIALVKKFVGDLKHD